MLTDINDRPNIQNWASLVRNTLSNLGFFNVWIAQGVGDVNIFLSVIKQRLSDTFVQNWHERLNESSRASFYRHICNFPFQPYLDTLTLKQYRVAMSKLRVSSHRLLIESGRWIKPQPIPRNERLCQICNKLEDEHHFLLECSLFTDERNKYIKPYYVKRTSMFKTVQLLGSDNKNEIKKLAVYIFKCFEKRNEALLLN